MVLWELVEVKEGIVKSDRREIYREERDIYER